MPPHPSLPIGTSDFRQLRTEGRLYVDKTDFITRVLREPARVLLLPRPRRFGKTTNLTTLAYFLASRDEDLSPLFADLAVWRSPAAREHFQRHPLLFLTFGDIQATTAEHFFACIADVLAAVYESHRYLLDAGKLNLREATDFRAIAERRADHAQCQAALKNLCRYLHRHHQQQVVLLLDDYDSPLLKALEQGYFDQVVDFYRGLLAAALKDNKYLFKGVLTGLLRVAKESVLSGRNNIKVSSLLEPSYAEDFGFTAAEVLDLARRAEFTGSLDELRAWYAGYLFGGTEIYNPWSVLTALDKGACRAYWMNTSSNHLIRDLMLRTTREQTQGLEEVLAGGVLRQRIADDTLGPDLDRDPTALWSFMLSCGYLRADELRPGAGGSLVAELRLPNRELKAVFEETFRQWLVLRLGGDLDLAALAHAILGGDAERCQHLLNKLLVGSASFFDQAGPANMSPEQLYHVFVLGLLLHLQPRYVVRSQREAGDERFDVILSPRQPGSPGVVLELKIRTQGKTMAQTLAEGLDQLSQLDYAADLRARGAAPLHELAVAFDGRAVMVKARTFDTFGRRRKKTAKPPTLSS